MVVIFSRLRFGDIRENEVIQLPGSNEERDFILINREINRNLYYELSTCVQEHKKNDQCTIFLTTGGGDPHAAYRMGRCIRNSYRSHVRLVVPSFCKSAGTLFAICADELAIGDIGELGPLDIQVSKPDELAGRNSGLDILNTLTQIYEHSLRVFREVLKDLRYGAGISTKLASQVAVEIAVGSVRPLYEQVDPVRLSEMNRAMQIAFEYGQRLNEYGCNLQDDEAFRCLLLGYPDHGFVIDRKEARSLFSRVENLSDFEISIYEKHKAHLFDPSEQWGPVFLQNASVENDLGGDIDEHHSDEATE